MGGFRYGHYLAGFFGALLHLRSSKHKRGYHPMSRKNFERDQLRLRRRRAARKHSQRVNRA